MNWLSDHVVLATLLGLSLIVGGATLLFRYLSRRVQDTPNTLLTSVFTVTVGGLVALVFGVFVNGLLAHKRERDGRIWSAREQHLARLQPILRADAETFSSLGNRAVDKGFFIDPRALGEGRTTDYQRAWQSENPLAVDLQNHFREEYAEARQKFVAAVESHDSAYNAAFAETLKQLIPMLPYEGHRDQVAGALLRSCVGLKGNVSLQVTGDGYSYAFDTGFASISGSGRGPPPQAYVALARAFRRFAPSPTSKAACDRLRNEKARVAATATELSKRARELSERTVLSGSCPFVEGVD